MRTEFSCHVGIDVRMAEFSGIGRYIRGMVTALAAEHPNGNYGLIGREETRGSFPAEFQFLGTRAPIYSFQEQWDFLRLGRHIECLHVPHYNAPLLWPRKMIITVHDLIHLHFPGHLPSFAAKCYACVMLPWIIKRADAIIAVSEHTKKDILETFDEKSEKITVIHHGIDPQLFAPGTRSETEPYFLYVGLIKEHKNLGVVLDAFEEFKKNGRNSKVKLTVVGKPDMKQPVVRGWFWKMKKNPDIRLLSAISDRELIDLYRNARALIFPSLYEGFGFPLLEAMAVGTPVLAAMTTSVIEILGQETALYFDPRSSLELENKMTKILDDDNLRAALVTGGKKRLPLFDWRTTAQKTRNVYETVIGVN